MKKNKKKLSLRRETLRVETFMNQVVGGWQTAQVNCDDYSDIGPDSQCAICGPDIISAGGCYSLAGGVGCGPSDNCHPETVLC